MTHLGKEPDFNESLSFDWDVITTEKYVLIMTRQQLLDSIKIPEGSDLQFTVTIEHIQLILKLKMLENMKFDLRISVI